MRTKSLIGTALIVLGVAGALEAQVTSQTEKVPGEAKVDTVKMTGEVLRTQGNCCS
jgi:hypothetical protein